LNSVDSSSPIQRIQGDARNAARLLETRRVDAIVCSPPYWKKRDYGHPNQLGQESTPEHFARALADVLETWIPILKPRASVLLNLGDSRRGNVLIPVTTFVRVRSSPARLATDRAHRVGQNGRNAQPTRAFGVASRIHFSSRAHAQTVRRRLRLRSRVSAGRGRRVDYRAEAQQKRASGAVSRRVGAARAAAHLPGTRVRRVRRTTGATLNSRIGIDETRPQARRALKKWRASNLTDAHLDAIRATASTTPGKSLRFHSGAGKNVDEVKRLAAEAKLALGGYFRNLWAQVWRRSFEACACGASEWQSGLALDPFCGSGTTLRAAQKLGRRAVGIDLMLDENGETDAFFRRAKKCVVSRSIAKKCASSAVQSA
jgi:hypothetical protein